MRIPDKQRSRRREARNVEKERKKAKKYLAQLKPGENLILLGRFHGIKVLVVCVAAILVLVTVNRLLIQNFAATMLSNILVVFAAFEASTAVANAQNSVVLVTDRRIFGVAGMTPFHLAYRDLKGIGAQNYIFLDTGDPKTSVRLRYLANTQDFYHAAMPLLQKHRAAP